VLSGEPFSEPGPAATATILFARERTTTFPFGRSAPSSSFPGEIVSPASVKGSISDPSPWGISSPVKLFRVEPADSSLLAVFAIRLFLINTMNQLRFWNIANQKRKIKNPQILSGYFFSV
jgi:hypothetical protein